MEENENIIENQENSTVTVIEPPGKNEKNDNQNLEIKEEKITSKNDKKSKLGLILTMTRKFDTFLTKKIR